MDSNGLTIFEDHRVKHEILVKINKLALWVFSLSLYCFMLKERRGEVEENEKDQTGGWEKWRGLVADQSREDVRHGLKEVASLDLVIEGGEKKGIAVSHLYRIPHSLHRLSPTIQNVPTIS